MIYLPKFDDFSGKLDLFKSDDVLDAGFDDFLDSLVDLGRQAQIDNSQKDNLPLQESLSKRQMQQMGCTEILDSKEMIKEYINENLWKYREMERARSMVYKDHASYRKTDICSSLLLHCYNSPTNKSIIVLLKPDIDQVAEVASRHIDSRTSRELLYQARFMWINELLHFLEESEKFGCYFCHKDTINDIKELPQIDRMIQFSQTMKLPIEEQMIAARIIKNSVHLQNYSSEGMSFDVVLPRYKTPEVIRAIDSIIKGERSEHCINTLSLEELQKFTSRDVYSQDFADTFEIGKTLEKNQIEVFSIFYNFYAQNHDMQVPSMV